MIEFIALIIMIFLFIFYFVLRKNKNIIIKAIKAIFFNH